MVKSVREENKIKTTRHIGAFNATMSELFS